MKQTFVSIFKLASAFMGFGLAVSSPAGSEAARLNLIFILAEDLGFSDLGAYGQKFAETPHLRTRSTHVALSLLSSASGENETGLLDSTGKF